MILPDLIPVIGGFFVGAAIAIIHGAHPLKRKKYMIKALGFYLGIFGGYALMALFQELIDHHERRKAFKQWKIKLNSNIS